MTFAIWPIQALSIFICFSLCWLRDVGVFCRAAFRKRQIYADQRIVLLKLLVLIDMTPRTA